MLGKRIGDSMILAERGVNLIQRIVTAMAFVWYQRGALDAGIDGHIEIRDPSSGIVTNLIILVQSKATARPFQKETPRSFEYLCDDKDLAYWMGGNVPVILIVSRPDTNEAYWVWINDYFKSPSVRQSRKILFDKERDRFDEGCASALKSLAIPEGSGLYLAPLPKEEQLYSNLLVVESFAERIFIAETEHHSYKEIWRELTSYGGNPGGEFILKEGRIISFRDLGQFPWRRICDPGTIEEFESAEWAQTEDRDKMNEFIDLLKRALCEKVRRDMRYLPHKHCWYFKATRDLSARKLPYQSRIKKTGRTVFQGYPRRDDPSKMSYYRHSAFEGRFHRLEGQWYFELTPTYYFTFDGTYPDRFGAERLKGIKRLEKHPAVLGQVIMWAVYLTQHDLFAPEYPYLKFGGLKTFTLDAGISDDEWLGKEEEDESEAVKSSLGELPWFGE